MCVADIIKEITFHASVPFVSILHFTELLK